MLRRILLVLLTALLGLTGWAGAAESAYAGGSTSVLLVNTGRARVHALHTTDSAHDRLAAAVGDADGWLAHDVAVWRVDRVVLTLDDGSRAHDDKALTAVLSAAGLLGTRAQPPGDSPASATAAPSDCAPAADGGLAIGALGALLGKVVTSAGHSRHQ